MFIRAEFNPRRRLVCYGMIGRNGYPRRAARLVRFSCGDYVWETPTFKVWAELVFICNLIYVGRWQLPSSPIDAGPDGC